MEEEDSKTKSSASQGSQKSVGMGPSLQANEGDIESGSSSRLTPEGGAPPGESIYDCMAFLIYCSKHEKIALSKAEKAVWMPYVVIPSSKTYASSASDGICIVLSKGHRELDATLQKKPPIKQNKSAFLTRIQLPNDRFITRLLQIVKLDPNSNDYQCCQNTKRLQWVPKNDVISGNIERVWGPEVTQMAKKVDKEVNVSIEEHSLDNALKHFGSESVAPERKVLASLGINSKELRKIYSDFVEHCYPSLFMSIHSFGEYMSNYGYERKDYRLVWMFNGFNIKGNEWLKFDEFLLGLAAMEPKSINEELRIKFIFRYYDIDKDKNLSQDEIKKILKDLFPNADDNVVNSKAKEVIKAVALDNHKISCDAFLKAVTSGAINGTETLCRFPKPILVEINKLMAEKSKKKKRLREKSVLLKANRKNKGICYGCRGKKFEYGLHSVKLGTSGRCVEPRRIFEPETLRADVMTNQRFSMEYKFNSRSIAHVFLDLIREFNDKKVKDKGFLSDEKDLFVKYLTNLCADSISLFAFEDRVMKLNDPMYIIGNICGQLEDLFTIESRLWHRFPVISANYLFLGNYVEFGGNGIECIIYLFALKLIAPKKIFLMKGCHEVRDYQIKHNFQKECIKKYGEKIGLKVWQLINSVFDVLPIAAIIDESIFCVNGGIPQCIEKVRDINDMSTDPKNFKQYSVVVNEVVNNEPLPADKKVESMTNGFAPNPDRIGAFWFNEEAVNNFLEQNGLSHIIRSNNIYNKTGYAFHFEDRCLTVFSNSNHNNELATVFIDYNRIRIVALPIKTIEKSNKIDSTIETVSKTDSKEDSV